MPTIVAPMGLEVLNIALVWLSKGQCDTTAKILLTLSIIIQFACYFVTAVVLDVESQKLRKRLLCVYAVIGGVLIAFSLTTNSFALLINNAVLLVLLVVWPFLTVFDILWTWGKKE